MNLFDILTMIGGLSLFLFGMSLMGQALERRAGEKLRTTLSKMTSNRLIGFLTGCGVTAVIQSSSATTIMVVGFVNSGLMTLKQAINVIMGANVGTTITSWLLSLGGIDSGNVWVRLLKPSSFTPVLAGIGIIYYLFCRSSKKKDTGMIFLGFATLMFGMETMSSAVSGLADLPSFQQMFLLFKNPLLGLLAGAFLTALIQSSSASVGILQALAATGQVSYAAAVPIIMGQNIGTCVTALASAAGAGKNAKRAAFVHLSFNVIGAVVLLGVFVAGKALFAPAVLNEGATHFGIALIHTAFNLVSVAVLMPLAPLLEKMALAVIPDSGKQEAKVELDERLLTAPALALEQCRSMTARMAHVSARSLKSSVSAFSGYTPELAEGVRADEEQTDHLEDLLGSYLVRLSGKKLNEKDRREITVLFKMIGDYERIADHALSILESAEELQEKKFTLTKEARKEFEVLAASAEEIVDLSVEAFEKRSSEAAGSIRTLERVIGRMKESMRTRHIQRMQQGDCSIEVGFIWSDVLTSIERAAGHCANIAGCILERKIDSAPQIYHSEPYLIQEEQIAQSNGLPEEGENGYEKDVFSGGYACYGGGNVSLCGFRGESRGCAGWGGAERGCANEG